MQLFTHIVKQGESLWAISNLYNVNPDDVYELNGLDDLTYLIPGQVLVIPTYDNVYVIKPGDTLWSISKRYDVPIRSIIAANPGINPNYLIPGTSIKIPGESNRYGKADVNAYIEPVNEEVDREIVSEVGKYLTEISPFSYTLKDDGTLERLKDEAVLDESKKYNISPLLTVTNLRGGNFDSDLISRFLNNEEYQENFIKDALSIMKDKNYYGLKLDIERVPTKDRENYNEFLRKVTDVMHKEGYIVSTALAPKTSDTLEGPWYGGHDYKAHGEIVDFVVIMTYEWGWSGGPPMAVAPVNKVKEVLDYAVSRIPPEKILMGMPLYGYDWKLPYERGGEWAKRISPQEALQLAEKYGQSIKYDEESQTPYFNYYDENGIKHEVWFEDGNSTDAKLKLVKDYGLKGVSYWVLGEDYPQNWALLEDRFKINKYK